MSRPETWVTATTAVGMTFGGLTVLEVLPAPKRQPDATGRARAGHPTAICRCTCGNLKRARLSNVVQGRTRSCGGGCMPRKPREPRA